MSDEIDTGAAVRAYLGQQAAPLKASLHDAVTANPETEAQLRRVAKKTGVDLSIARVAPDEVKRQAAMIDADADTLTRQFPQTASFLMSPDNARVAHDDIGTMKAVEGAVKYLFSAPDAPRGGLASDVGKAGKAIASGAWSLSSGMYGAAASPLEVLGQLSGSGSAADAGAWLRGQSKAAGDTAKSMLPDMRGMGPEEQGLWSGFQSAGQNMLMMPFGLATGGERAMLGLMGAATGGQSYTKGREAGLSPAQATAFGVQDATAEVLTEKYFGAAGLLKNIKAGASAGKLFGYEVAKEVPGEIGATLWQNFNEWAHINPDKSVADFVVEQPDAIRQTIIATLVGGSVQIGAVKGIEGIAGRAQRDEQKAKQAEQRAQAMTELAKLAEASKLRERDPEAFQTFAQSLTDAGVPRIYVDPKALADSGVDLAELAKAIPSAADQIQRAAATGGDIVIPTAELLTALPGQTFAQSVIEHARTAEDAMSPAEAKVYMQERGDQLQAEIAKVLESKQGDDAFKAERDKVRDEFAVKLDAAKRFTSDVNQQYASLMADFYAAQAARLGITPSEMAARYPLTVRRDGQAGANTLEQAGPGLDALREQWDGAGIKHAISEKGGIITVGQIVVPEGERSKGAGTAAMQALIDYADRTGQHVALSPSEDFGGNKKRLTEFYKRFGFVENKGKNRAFKTSESMYREAPGKVLEQSARAQITFGQDITQTPSVLTLFQGADLSSFIHEAGHFFLEAQADLAARIQGQINDGAAVSDGEREIVADMNRLLDWFGIKGDEGLSALDQWHTMTLDEKRQHHETFARGFEAYAFEGRAPSLSLQATFQRFRAWMVNIYKSLKALNVTLTDEVRGVMDRMIATSDAIREAEAARNMGALFGTAEQAGMTPEDFAAYHALAVDATQEAIQTLQARGLRDMQWMRGAHSRKLKELQKRSKALRAEVEREVRAEVMARPVYQAWQFLTGKGDAIDRAQKTDTVKASGALDPSKDNIFTAIAKLGGLNRAEVASTWGLDPKDRLESGVFGVPVVRKDGGLSIDAMLERLVAEGYIMADEFGKGDVRDLEEAFDSQRRGSDVFSMAHDYAERIAAAQGEQPVDGLPAESLYGKLNTEDLRQMYGTQPEAIWRRLSERRMTSDKEGISPEIVAATFGFSGADEMVRALADAQVPRELIGDLTDQRMMERFGDITSPEALERAADEAIHNEARARAVATEVAALQRAASVKAPGANGRSTVDVMAKAAREYAAGVVARMKIRDIRPSEFVNAASRAGRAAEKAFKAGDIEAAATEKRNQLIQSEGARAANEGKEEAEKALAYLRKFSKRSKSIDADYADQIEALLDRFQLRPESKKAADRRTSLSTWLAGLEAQGIVPDIDPDLIESAGLKSWQDMTLEELRGLRDAVKQIEHLGRLKDKLLTAADQRSYEAVRDEMAGSITENAGDRKADTRTPSTVLGKKWAAVKNFGAAHIKVSTLARVFDGGKDGGPVWEYILRPANERANMETTMRANATEALTKILAPVLKQKMGGRGVYFESIGRTLNREQIFAMALNTGNEGNLQRLLGGEGWTSEQIMPVLRTLTAEEWRAVQGVWDHIETYRPEIGAKHRRVYGKEPAWVEAQPFTIQSADGQSVVMRGGYYPIKYDPLASVRAEEHADAEGAKQMLKGAYTSATTKRGFTKTRVETVKGRPLLYSLAGVYSGLNDVIHDLAWHEWLIDVNKLMRSEKIDGAIRQHYGPEAVKQIKAWIKDIAAGEAGLQAELDSALGKLRHGVSVAGLGFNVMSAAMQPLGLTQSIVRVGAKWIGIGVAQYVASPIAATRRVNEASEFMASRSRTRFRELAELRNQVEGETKAREVISSGAYFLMMRCQQMVDTPTWLGAYEKAISEGNDEARSVALADQAVIDAQGGGQTKDLSAIERGGPAQKLFTVFYSFMNTALNAGIAKTMTANTPAKKAKLAVDYLMLYTVPAVLGALLKDALTPGDAGDDDPEKLAKKLAAEQLSFLMGLMVVVREFSQAGQTLLGLSDRPRDYSGPAGLRMISDVGTFAKQAQQGEFDDSFRKATINLLGDLFALPSAQINRTITGAQALNEGKTTNPAALLFGYQEEK
jgi:GNAT superfamily N-acetyltransferase